MTSMCLASEGRAWEGPSQGAQDVKGYTSLNFHYSFRNSCSINHVGHKKQVSPNKLLEVHPHLSCSRVCIMNEQGAPKGVSWKSSIVFGNNSVLWGHM